MSTGQRAVMLCDWGVKADMMLFAGNTVWSISERVRGVCMDALYKSTFTLLYFTAVLRTLFIVHTFYFYMKCAGYVTVYSLVNSSDHFVLLDVYQSLLHGNFVILPSLKFECCCRRTGSHLYRLPEGCHSASICSCVVHSLLCHGHPYRPRQPGLRWLFT